MISARISISGLTFSFGTSPVIGGLSLACQPGERLAILGQSGIGKTTILRLIAGLLDPSSGSVAIDDAPPAALVATGRLGMVFQEPALLPYLPVRGNIEISRKFRSGKQGQLCAPANRLAAIAAAMRVTAFLDRRPAELSGGMKTRVALARALFCEPRLLLLDEPFRQLDDILKHDIYEDFSRIQTDRSITTVLVTHDVTEALLLSDRIAILKPAEAGAAMLSELSVPFGPERTPSLSLTPAFCDLAQHVRSFQREAFHA